ncbi:MAG: virion morphogenesis protein, partial [Salinarimonadaceae bacterium]
GGAPVFARSVTIPARPFLGFGPAEIETTLDVIEGALDRAMGSR